MKPTRRQGLLFAALIPLCGALIWSIWSRWDAEVQRQAQHQQTLASHQNDSQSVEKARVELGEVWTGELHPPLDILPIEATSPSGGSDSHVLNQRRIASSLKLSGLGFTLNTELHECDPGADVCSTGGSIQVFLGSHFVCAVSVGLLRLPVPGVPSSQYRIEWQDHVDGRPLSPQEKLDIVQKLARGARPASADEFQRLMEIAYAHSGNNPSGDEQQENLRTLVATIFSAIADSRDI
jgi:hypothetical protein